jgi:hypothetical protein
MVEVSKSEFSVFLRSVGAPHRLHALPIRTPRAPHVRRSIGHAPGSTLAWPNQGSGQSAVSWTTHGISLRQSRHWLKTGQTKSRSLESGAPLSQQRQ